MSNDHILNWKLSYKNFVQNRSTKIHAKADLKFVQKISTKSVRNRSKMHEIFVQNKLKIYSKIDKKYIKNLIKIDLWF